MTWAPRRDGRLAGAGARAFDRAGRLYWPGRRLVGRARRRWLVVRAELTARAVGARLRLEVAPDVWLGRGLTIDVLPATRNELIIGPGTQIGDDAVFQFLGGSISIGAGTTIRKGFRADSSGRLRIGDGVFIGYGSFVHCAQATTIEDLAVLAEYTAVTDSRHLRTPLDVPNFHHVRAAPTRVGRNAWVAAHAVVAAGVDVGDGAFVGANAVVTKAVPPGWLAGGNPARLIRELAVEGVVVPVEGRRA
jgi:acetyltransferase-like isoleucine patch superfamily enzyme